MGFDYFRDYLRRDVKIASGPTVNFPSPINSFRIGLPAADRRFVLVLSWFPQDSPEFFLRRRLEVYPDYPGPDLRFSSHKHLYRSKVALYAAMPLRRGLEKALDYRRLYDVHCRSGARILYPGFTVRIYSTVFAPLWNALDPQFADFWIGPYLLRRLAHGPHRHSRRILLLPGISIDR